MQGLLFDVEASDPRVLASATALVTPVTLVAAGAKLLPARRATRVDPTEALRVE